MRISKIKEGSKANSEELLTSAKGELSGTRKDSMRCLDWSEPCLVIYGVPYIRASPI